MQQETCYPKLCNERVVQFRFFSFARQQHNTSATTQPHFCEQPKLSTTLWQLNANDRLTKPNPIRPLLLRESQYYKASSPCCSTNHRNQNPARRIVHLSASATLLLSRSRKYTRSLRWNSDYPLDCRSVDDQVELQGRRRDERLVVLNLVVDPRLLESWCEEAKS